jgi:ribosomal protein S18 acetylase RimI-like enzyme
MNKMDNYTIRDYNRQDFNQLSTLWEATGVGSTKRGDNAQIIDHSIELGGKLIVLIDDDINQLFGSSWMTFDGRRLHLHHIAVKPSYQNKGYGKILTKESLKFAKEKGYQIKLEVHQTNKKAINIYKQLGFKFLGDYDVYIVRNLDSIAL